MKVEGLVDIMEDPEIEVAWRAGCASYNVQFL